jgi:hypothetical protein
MKRVVSTKKIYRIEIKESSEKSAFFLRADLTDPQLKKLVVDICKRLKAPDPYRKLGR